jgi:phosphoglycolate phosphatase-like HAD superfamily hydrolase
MLSGFIFDVEGTLVDSVPQNLRSLQDALERFGHRVPYQTLHLYSGLDGDQTLQLVVPDAAEPERKEILEVQGTIYEKSYLDSVRPFDGVRDVFRALTQRGGRIALATDCKGLAFKLSCASGRQRAHNGGLPAATMLSTASQIPVLWVTLSAN